MRPIFAAISSGLLLASPLAAAEFDFNPAGPCTDTIRAATPQKAYYVGMWAVGYRMAQEGAAQGVTFTEMDAAWSELKAGCDASPSASLLDLLAGVSEVGPEGLLRAFFAPNADFAALTAELRPSEADIRAVYNDPLATALVANYAGMYDGLAESGGGLAPKATQTELLIVETTTDELVVNPDMRAEFPGGYGDVLPYMNGGFPIVRFKFVEPGATSGRAFDGLIFVNDHWVLMPKPWRSLD